MEWDGTRSDDGAGAGGVALGWVFTVEGGAGVRVHRDGQGVMRGGRNESGWVRIGESLTLRYCVPTVEAMVIRLAERSVLSIENSYLLGN